MHFLLVYILRYLVISFCNGFFAARNSEFINNKVKVACCKEEIVGNRAKGRISKRVSQENKARQIFRKTIISYPLIRTRSLAYQGVRNVCFSENLTCFVFM